MSGLQLTLGPISDELNSCQRILKHFVFLRQQLQAAGPRWKGKKKKEGGRQRPDAESNCMLANQGQQHLERAVCNTACLDFGLQFTVSS